MFSFRIISQEVKDKGHRYVHDLGSYTTDKLHGITALLGPDNGKNSYP